jgi:hypothetical protein
MHRMVLEKRNEIAALCRQHHVRHLEVFGSAARSEDFQLDSSDADVIAEFEATPEISPLEQFFGFRNDLSRLLGRPVDLIEASAIRNPYLLATINRARTVVYAA